MISTVGKFTLGFGSEVNAWRTVAAHLLLAVMLLIGFAAPAAPEEVPLQEGLIDFPLEVDTDSTGKLHWIILPPDNPAQIQVSNPEARTMLFDIARDLLMNNVSRDIQNTKGLGFAGVFNGFFSLYQIRTLEKRLKLVSGNVVLGPFTEVEEGVERGARARLKAPIKYGLMGEPVTSLNLVLTIGASNAGTNHITTLGELGSLVQIHGPDDTTLSTDEAKIVVSTLDSMAFTTEELQQLTPQLVQIAIDGLKHATAQGLAFGKLPPIFPKPDNALDHRFRFPGSVNVTLFIKQSPTPSFSHELSFGVLNVVRKITVKSLNERYRTQANKLIDKFQSSLPQVWAAEFDQELTDRLSDDKRVIGLEQPQLENGNYIITPKLGGALFEGSAKATVGLSYSTDKQVTGAASVTVSNLTGRNEQTSIDAQLGEEVGEAKLNFSLPYPPYRTLDGRLRLSSFLLNATYTRDQEQRYRLVETDQELYRGGLGYHVIWDQLNAKQRAQWGSPTIPNRKRWDLVTQGKLTLDYEDWHFRRQSPGSPRLNDGEFAVVGLSLDEIATIDLRQGTSWLRELEIPVHVGARYGVDITGDNNDYTQLDFSVRAQLFLRSWQDKDILFNLAYRGGVTETDTPVFKTFQIGNDQTVRGLESGEVLAATYAFQSVEAGVSLATLLRSLLNSKAQNGEGAQSSIIRQLSETYLKVFYDQGSVSSKASLSELFRFDSDLQGYGITLSLQIPFQGVPAELEIGYARSPDSKEHSSGLFFTRLVVANW